jgi:hypothetical protein
VLWVGLRAVLRTKPSTMMMMMREGAFRGYSGNPSLIDWIELGLW